MSGGVTDKLCEWLCSVHYEELPAEVRNSAVNVVLDSVGGMLACSTLPEAKSIVDFVEALGGKPECTIIGHTQRAAVVGAAMANGAMAHGDEVDPVHLSSAGGHVAAGPLPTALTVGEWVGASGKDVLRALALGYEVGGRLMTILYRERDYVARRFYHTSVAGALGSAVAAGSLLRLNRRELQSALGLAAYQAAGPDNMTRDPGHMGKTFQVAAANRNGVTAALLAQRGCFVPLDILDGAFFDAFLGNADLGRELLDRLGDYYAITDVMHKRYPAGSPNQTYLQGLFRLLDQHGIRPKEIQEIEIHIPKRGVHRIPTTRHASISGEIVCAMAAVHGNLDFYQIHDPTAVATPAVEEMRRRVRFVARDDWQGMEHGRHAIVRLTTTQSRKLEEEIWFQPMNRRDIEEKFGALVVPRLGKEKSRSVQELVERLENAESVRPLMEELAGAA